MESKAKKILIYKVRNFSEKFDDTFAFVRENWKVMFKYLTYLILPVCLLQAIALNGYMETAFNMSSISSGTSSDMTRVLQSLGWSYGGLILASIVGGVLLVSVVYGLMSIYDNREERLEGLTGSDFKPVLLKNLKRSGLAVLLFMAIMILGIIAAAMLVVMLSPLIALPIVLVLMVMAIPMLLFMPIYLMEDISFMQALQKALRLGFSTWWSTFALILVLGFIVSFIQGIFAIPYYVMVVVKTVLGLQGSGTEFFDSVGYSFIMYLFGVLQAYATYLLTSLMAVGLALQYGHASEKKDHVTMENNINRFEEL